MNDQELRALVRAAVERHLGGQAPPALYPPPAARSAQTDASHYVYVSLTNVSDACVIEPNVPCTHCNYCKSHGH
ncbi:MAG TPA: hypothetical protein VFV98_20615 [Vicinamibacterales bacterium]|nr:hypothetical protein [Vicinamibacterales bacterium]